MRKTVTNWLGFRHWTCDCMYLYGGWYCISDCISWQTCSRVLFHKEYEYYSTDKFTWVRGRVQVWELQSCSTVLFYECGYWLKYVHSNLRLLVVYYVTSRSKSTEKCTWLWVLHHEYGIVVNSTFSWERVWVNIQVLKLHTFSWVLFHE